MSFFCHCVIARSIIVFIVLLAVSCTKTSPEITAITSNFIISEVSETTGKCCASCGIAEVDEIKMIDCDGCDLVRYCSDKCKEGHRPEHEMKCKGRAAELREEILFKQPESSCYGDCPICCLPLPIDVEEHMLQTCCSKLICIGCAYVSKLRHYRENRQRTCPFCRHPVPNTQEEMNLNAKKRVEANDPEALLDWAKDLFHEGNHEGAYKYYNKAAELGNANAHYNLSISYQKGDGVEGDEKKEVYHLEEAVIRGHPEARHNLAVLEWKNGRIERAVKHWIIAATLGDDSAIKSLKECYKDGDVSKDDFATALRAHHAAVDATKSPQREEAARFYARLCGR